MTADISIVGTITALVLPMLLGGVWVYWLLGRTERWHPALVAGHGYLVGMFAITLLIRAWDLAGLALNFWGIAAIASALTACGFALLRAKPVTARTTAGKTSVPGWQLTLTLLLLALMVWRYSTIFQEVLLRPLYPWDAWMNWAPKAVVWYHYSELVPFADMGSWLAAPAEALTHIEGARNAWKYPAGVPLVQLWGMLGAGTNDHTVIYLPWMFIGLAMGAALYGHLKLVGASSLLALTAVYALLNMPFINVHSALAGYADLWVAVTFGASALALSEWSTNRHLSYAVLSVVLALFCTQLKIPGLIMGGIIIAALCLLLLKLPPRGWLILFGIAVAALFALYFIEIRFSIAGIGEVHISRSVIAIPYIGDFDIALHNVTDAMLNTLLRMINWNLLWYVFVASLGILLFNPRFLPEMKMETLILAMTLSFIFFVYYFTERYRFALDYTQVNRALIYTVPLICFFVFKLLHTVFFGSDSDRAVSE